MNRAQKIAWTLVILFFTGLILSVTAVLILYSRYGMPRALAGLGFMGIFGLGGFSPLIFKKDKGKVTFDERDRLIKRRAALTGFASAYLFVGLACMIPFFLLGPNGSIKAHWLPPVFGGAGITHFFAYSVAILYQYGWRSKEDE